MSRVETVFKLLDELNAQDPNTEVDNDTGKVVAKELRYSKLMTRTLEEFEPNAPDVVKIAVHAQHVARWKLARADYPAGRAGYLKWRTDLGKFHAKTTVDIMRETGAFSEPELEQTRTILTKQTIKNEVGKRDANVQLLEDVACLVFLRYYFQKFTNREDMSTDKQKLITIVRRTWVKMSEKAHQAAFQSVSELRSFLEWADKFEADKAAQSKRDTVMPRLYGVALLGLAIAVIRAFR